MFGDIFGLDPTHEWEFHIPLLLCVPYRGRGGVDEAEILSAIIEAIFTHMLDELVGTGLHKKCMEIELALFCDDSADVLA